MKATPVALETSPSFNENWRLQSILKGAGKRPERSVQRSKVCFHNAAEPEIIGHYGGDMSDDDESDCDPPHQNGNDLPDGSGGLFIYFLANFILEPTGIFCLIMGALVFWLNEPGPHFSCRSSSKCLLIWRDVQKKLLVACFVHWATTTLCVKKGI
jgi:hypothetical protein